MGLSGGKDSAALALYMNKYRPDIEIEYFFCDTHEELPETYNFLYRLEARLGKKIEWLSAERGFNHWLEAYGGFLPSVQARWCTRELKIVPMEKFVGNDKAISYIGIRADEDRQGYFATSNSNITPIFPFFDGDYGPEMNKDDVIELLADSGVGMPDYYKWRSRSGCYFCFYQRKYEWVQLAIHHPELFEKAMQYEQAHEDGRRYFWNQDESLHQLIARKNKILSEHNKAMANKQKNMNDRPLIDVFNSVLEDENDGFCFVCNL